MCVVLRHDRNEKGMDVTLRVQPWDHLTEQITRSTLRVLDEMWIVGRLGLGVEGDR